MDVEALAGTDGTMTAMKQFWLWLRRFFVKPTRISCPQCYDDAKFWPEDGGEGSSMEFGRTGWVEGHAECKQCGFKGYYQDSWP